MSKTFTLERQQQATKTEKPLHSNFQVINRTSTIGPEEQILTSIENKTKTWI